jgi:diguanylate cyclase (GGDEF)-like protein/PAS domain S-box-containing protein
VDTFEHSGEQAVCDIADGGHADVPPIANGAVRGLLDASPDCALLLDGQWRMRYLNRQAVERIGRGRDLAGRSFWYVFAASGGTPIEEPLRRAAAERQPARVEALLPMVDAWQEIRLAPLPDGTMALWLRDISRRKEAHTALALLEDRARLIGRATLDIVYDWDVAANTVAWNEALHETFGHRLENPVTDLAWWMNLIHPDDYQGLADELDRTLNGSDEHFVAEYRFRRADGTYADVYERGCIVRDEVGRAVRVVGAVQDHSLRNGALRALRQRDADLAVVCDHASIGILHRGAQGKLLWVNRRFCEILGRTEDELETLDVAAYTHPDDLGWNTEEQYARIARGERVQLEKRYVRPDGSIVWCDVRVSQIDPAEGRDSSFVIVAQDITERRNAADALRRSEERLRLIQEASEMADFESGEGTTSICSDRFFEQAGLPVGDNRIVFEDFLKLVHPEDQKRIHEEVLEALKHGDLFSSEFRIHRADTGEERWISCRTKMIRNRDGIHVRTIGAHRDITHRKRSEEALRESEERFRLAAEAAGLGVWDYDVASGRREWSDCFREIWGLPAETEADFDTAIACIHPEDRSRFVSQLRHIINEPATDRFEASLRIRRHRDGAERWVAVSAWTTIGAPGADGRVIVTVRDVTEVKTAEERVLWSANHDGLTGLANRALFQTRLDAAIHKAAGTGGSVGLLLLDVDHFKQINDSLGHDAGDTLLKMFAERLQSTVRTTDTVARFGGDEFAIVVPGLDGFDRLRETADAILARLREPFIHGGKILDCRASIGASSFPDQGQTSEALLKNADMALYAAKSAGRGIAAVFRPQMRTDAHRQSSMLQLARDAIGGNRLVSYYQPKVDLVTGAPVGFEALLRWRDSRGRVHLPATLKAAFDDLEVAAAISDRIIERTIGDMRRWLDRGVPFHHVAVNASAAEFRRNDFAERVLEQLHAAGIPTAQFQLEVTESVFLGRGAEYVHRALRLLNSAGVKIALDDFGTGYASLRHLKEFPVDVIKIDRSFVRDMDVDPGDEAIVRAVITLGRSLGIKVVAEGIESRAQADRLVELDCDFGQGFLFSRAVPPGQVPRLITRLAPASGAPTDSPAEPPARRSVSGGR